MTKPVRDIVDVDGVTIRYRTTGGDGDGPPIVFVHGVYVGGALWDPLADRLDGIRCVLPTWPHGAHADPAPEADLSARAAARRIPAFLEALDLHDVTLVGNDTGGGLCLAALGSGHSGLSRVGRLVLTNCDSYEHFPPKGFAPMVKAVRRTPRVGRLMLRALASGPGRRLFLRSVCARPPADLGDIFEAFVTSGATRADAARLTASLEPSVTLETAGAIPDFDKPVLVAWGADDRLFPVEQARRLADDFPHGELRVIPEASTYVMLDQPDELAAVIRNWIGS